MALVGSRGDQRGEDLSTGTATGAGRVTECPGGCVGLCTGTWMSVIQKREQYSHGSSCWLMDAEVAEFQTELLEHQNL